MRYNSTCAHYTRQYKKQTLVHTWMYTHMKKHLYLHGYIPLIYPHKFWKTLIPVSLTKLKYCGSTAIYVNTLVDPCRPFREWGRCSKYFENKEYRQAHTLISVYVASADRCGCLEWGGASTCPSFLKAYLLFYHPLILNLVTNVRSPGLCYFSK